MDDAAALTFANRFYEIFLTSVCFGDAVKKGSGRIQPFVSLSEYVIALKNIAEDAKTSSAV